VLKDTGKNAFLLRKIGLHPYSDGHSDCCQVSKKEWQEKRDLNK
jgi:hypothetical protein